MSIKICNHTAHITNSIISYVIEIADGKYPVHRYFGKAIRNYRGAGAPVYYKRGYNTSHESETENVSFDDFPFEYPIRGYGDFRIPALSIIQETGIEFVQPIFKSWTVLNEKPALIGLPSTFDESGKSETLKIICEDEIAGIRIHMYYTIFDGLGIIARSQCIENIGEQTLMITNAKSLSLELPHGKYDYLTLYGTHAKEANVERFTLHHGIQKTESSRGSSSPQYHPFFAIVSPDTSEEKGDIYGFHLIYSGNFSAETELDQFGNVRAQLGINPEGFRWELKKGETFYTPEAILNYSGNGLNGMSHQFHQLYKEHLMPKRFVHQAPPILLNSWESMYYDVNLEKIDKQADMAKALGMELFVLDDGWFRAGNTSHNSMGDWICNTSKLPGGIEVVSNLIRSKGLKFGLWFEPEAVSKDSKVCQEHPDWVLHVPKYQATEGRHEYLFDLSKPEVRDYIVDFLSHYIEIGKLDYIKWDMNRPLTDVHSAHLSKTQKGETAHRYVLGLYDILDTITKKYPSVLFEGCSSGGARFDPGMLYYFSQNWTSDNTDAYDRMTIQSGYSMLYPPIAMGAHVSIVPNHQTGRYTPLATRHEVASLFNFGYELDLTKLSSEELDYITTYIAQHKQQRDFYKDAIFWRHDVPDDNYVTWSIVNKDKTECRMLILQKMFNPLATHVSFLLNGLDEAKDYKEINSNRVYGGDELMQLGMTVPVVHEDFHTFIYHFVQV